MNAKPKDSQASIDTLNAATVTYRADYVKRAEELYMTGLIGMRGALAANQMDLNKVAPYPSSTSMGCKEYRMKLALHQRYTASFEMTEEARRQSTTGMMYGKLPWTVVEKPDAEAKVRAEARSDANACFDSYIYKLAGKVGKSITSATMTGHLWEGSTLTVACTDGENQTWTTKCIINQSVYGKLFNQWPTRRAS